MKSSGYIDVCVGVGWVWVGMREYERASCAYAVYRRWRVEVYFEAGERARPDEVVKSTGVECI